MKEKYSYSSPSPSPPSKLSLHRGTRLISKLKPPKIRIIHIVAPEIINIDAANFRELVQALTGKPSAPGGDDQCSNLNSIGKSTSTSLSARSQNLEIKEEEDDLLNEFVDLDGFVQLISPHHELPFMSKSPPHYHLDLGGDHAQIHQ